MSAKDSQGRCSKRHYHSWRQSAELYGNITLLGVNKEQIVYPIARISDRHAKFYLNRGLASRVHWDSQLVGSCISRQDVKDDPDGKGILLNFEPRGSGHLQSVNADFWLSERQSQCCVCGSQQQLTMHHLIPLRFRRWLALSVKSHNCHDVLSLCVSCHEHAEDVSASLERELAAEYDDGDPLRAAVMAGGRSHTLNDMLSVCVLSHAKAMKYAVTLSRKQAAHIPSWRKVEMLREIAASTLPVPSLEDLIEGVEIGTASDHDVSATLSPLIEKGLPLFPICHSFGYDVIRFLLNSVDVAAASRRLDETALLEAAVSAGCSDQAWRDKAVSLIQRYKATENSDRALMSAFCRPGDDAHFTADSFRKISQFFYRWRQAFIDGCQPRFLPAGWTVDAPILPDNEVLHALESVTDGDIVSVSRYEGIHVSRLETTN